MLSAVYLQNILRNLPLELSRIMICTLGGDMGKWAECVMHTLEAEEGRERHDVPLAVGWSCYFSWLPKCSVNQFEGV